MELILGTAQLDGSYGRFRRHDSDQTAPALLSEAWRLGFHTLDTAASYAGVEEQIGQSDWPGEIHTKLDPALSPTDSVSQSLRRLGRESLNVVYFHTPDIVRQSPSQTLHVRELLPRSLVQRLGVSVYSPEEAVAALEHTAFEVIQIPLNLADGRWSNQLLSEIQSTGRLLIARSVFLQGALLRPSRELPLFLHALQASVEKLHALSEKSGRTVAELALAWVRGKPGVSGIIVGAETVAQLGELSAAFHAPTLSSEETSMLDSLALNDLTVIDPRTWPRD